MNSSLDNSTISTSNGERVVFLDYLRVAACFMVILVHCIEPFYLGGNGTYIASHSDALWVTLINSLLRIAVPLFVMTSSYLLVPIKGETSRFFKRRAERVVIPFIIWSLLYAVVPMWGSGGEIDITRNLEVLTLNFMPHGGHLWFIYMLLGVYLVMPIISPWLERVSARGERIFLALWLLATAVPFLRVMAEPLRGSYEVWGEASWNEFGTLYYVSGFVGYVVAAHYIRTHLSWSVKRRIAAALPMLVVGYVITALPFYQQIPATFPVNESIDLAIKMELSWSFATTGTALQTIAVFLLFSLIQRPCRIYPLIRSISERSYGIYLMHMFILVIVFEYVKGWALATPLTMILSAVITFTLCSLITRLISYLPKSKYIIG